MSTQQIWFDPKKVRYETMTPNGQPNSKIKPANRISQQRDFETDDWQTIVERGMVIEVSKTDTLFTCFPLST